MGSSSGFGSTPRNLTPYSDSLSLWLHLDGLTLLRRVTRRPIMQKVRSRTDHRVAPTITVLLPLVDIRFQVLFHSPHRGAFHLSLTVLVHYRKSTRLNSSHVKISYAVFCLKKK